MRCFRLLFITFFVFHSSLSPAQEFLQKEDVGNIMQEMMTRHVDHHQMTEEILKKSLKMYVDAFDPQRIYLLQAEADPYININPSDLRQFYRDYQKRDFSEYERLQDQIQKSIVRARVMRGEMKKQLDSLFREPPVVLDKNDAEGSVVFAKSEQQLRARIEDDFRYYLEDLRRVHGARALAERPEQVFAKYDAARTKLEDQYFYTDTEGKPLGEKEKENLLVIHVLKSLAKSLDSHTRFLDPSEAFDMKTRLEKGFYGIGIVVEEKNDKKVIRHLIPGGPAEKTGLLQVNDQIVTLDGVDVDQLTLEEVREKLRNQNQPKVTLKITRTVSDWGFDQEKTLSVTLNREMVEIDDGRVDIAEEKFGNGYIGIITLHSFYQGSNGITSEKDVRDAVRKLQKKGPLRGLVLDLRDNSGGFLSQAVKVAGLFITNGVVVVSRYSSGEQRTYRDMDGKVTFDGPIVVLTSKATASAAEIVAQALQDYGVAVIVGDEQTYGKGTIQSQTITDNKSTSFFKVTVGKYYTVSGKTPQKVGVKADVVVPSIFTHFNIGEEYLESAMGPDAIPPSYRDALTDIKPGLRPWFMRFYMPSLQDRESTWQKMLPQLKQNSSYRMARNLGYQDFLRNSDGREVFQDEAFKRSIEDYQREEAVNILKDMVMLEPQYDSQEKSLAEQ